ncbi:MAG: hypothetical protein ABMA13_09440 [Chthoniobacteraceae bacterium]
MIYDLRIAIFAALGVAVVRADDSAWRVWLEPKFMHAPVAVSLADAQKTQIAAGMLSEDGFRSFTKVEFAALGVSREVFHSVAVLNASIDLRSADFRFVRDRRGIISYGVVESRQPRVASAVLAPGFLGLWKETLGDAVLVVVPNRFTAFVFPRLASDYMDYAPMVFRAYRDTAYPVSAEVFAVSADGWRCIGAYAEP